MNDEKKNISSSLAKIQIFSIEKALDGDEPDETTYKGNSPQH